MIKVEDESELKDLALLLGPIFEKMINAGIDKPVVQVEAQSH